MKKIKINKQEKLICNLKDPGKYVVLIRNSKQTINHKLELEKVHRVIKINQNDSLKTYMSIGMIMSRTNKLKFWIIQYWYRQFYNTYQNWRFW